MPLDHFWSCAHTSWRWPRYKLKMRQMSPTHRCKSEELKSEGLGVLETAVKVHIKQGLILIYEGISSWKSSSTASRLKFYRLWLFTKHIYPQWPKISTNNSETKKGWQDVSKSVSLNHWYDGDVNGFWASGAEILLWEWILKACSNRCRLLAASLTNSADSFLEEDQQGHCFGEQERQTPRHWERRRGSLRLMTYFVKADKKHLR